MTRLSLRKTTIRRAAIFALFFLLPLIIFARDIEITVLDEDIAIPLEGAVVVVRGGKQFICDTNGIAKVTLIDDRQTVISVTYPGYETLRLSIPAANKSDDIEKFTASMRLGGVMQSQELVLEVARPDTSETKSGRSVAISDRDLERTAEIGIVEDVMNSVKLLPGVGYTGMFRAMPSIRGGDPGDLMAALDGFYLERPYHWMGSISVFDPKMVSSARLSHGVFSARYGHTISGLLEVTSKSPSSTETEIEAALGSSAASLNLSLPMWNKGGVLFMVKVTYWDTFVWAAKGLSKVTDNETLDMVNSVTTAPYIRSAGVSMNYRFTPDLDWKLNAFFGSDGVGVNLKTDYSRFTDGDITGIMEMNAEYDNYQGFLISGLTASPSPKVALKFTGGVGFIKTVTDDYVDNNITAHYNREFINKYSSITGPLGLTTDKTYKAPDVNLTLELDNTIFNAQGRADADVELGNGFIAAFGVQELYSRWKQAQAIDMFMEVPVKNLPPEYIYFLYSKHNNPVDFIKYYPILGLSNDDYAAVIQPRSYSSDLMNHGFTTSAYGLVEYTSPNQRIGTELGLRLDHLYFKGRNFDFQTKPALNPRLNIDFGILKNKGIIDSLTATIGTGLFSSINPLISFVNGGSSLNGMDMKFNRSWTSVIGFKVDFAERYSFNIEGYYKRVFDRAYVTADTAASTNLEPKFNFDGVGNVWGFDLQLQKLESRYLDGWISYTYTWAKYMDPNGNNSSIRDSWYYPSFHRFHNFNLVLNIKPLRWFNIAARFGFASGQPRRKVSDVIYPYPVQVIDENGIPQLDEGGNPVIIQKYRRDSWYDENERTAWSLPLDLKFSFFPSTKNRRAHMEIYAAAENILSLIYTPAGRTRFNEYTGREDPDAASGNFDFPIPMISFGFKWRY